MDFSHILTEPYTLVLTCVLAVSFILLAIFYGLFDFKVGRFRRRAVKTTSAQADNENLPPVSVVLVAQNDGEWLRSNLLYLLEQDYPDFEVVVVNYVSSDDTKFVLQVLSENYKRLKVVTFQENVSGYQGKKYPLSIGIRSAKNDILLFAEPDCVPNDLQNYTWIREMVAGYVHEHVDIVLGFSGIQYKPTLLNWLQQYDNMTYSVEYLGASILNRPFSGNGRNLSYRRSLFLSNNGFIYHYYEPYGADDMFVNQNSRRYNTSQVLTPNSFTMTQPQASLGQWRQHRKIRTSTHKYYSFGLKIFRLIRPLAVVFFYLSAALLLAAGTFPWEILALLLVLKLAWQIVASLQAAKRLQVKPVVAWLSPLMEIYFLISNTILSFSPLNSK